MLSRPNWVEINLDALNSNLTYVKSLVPNKTKILMPVKADAYGHGSLACSYTAEKIGIDYLGVAHLFEGVLLRQHGITIPILILGPLLAEDFDYVLSYNLTPTISSLEIAKTFNQYLTNKNSEHQAHLKIDTGMNRYGIKSSNLEEIIKVLNFKSLKIEGMFSHLATADDVGNEFTKKQIDEYMNVINNLEKLNLKPEICHLSNSAGTINHPEIALDMIRPGIVLYGYDSMGEYDDNLTPMLTMTSTIRHLHCVKAGTSVSYGQIWKASKDTKVATVAIGYGDGFPRGIKDGVVYIRGERCPIIGRICMDATMVDVSHLDQIEIGEEVKIIDGSLSSEISVESLAKGQDTISYEITCHLARRLYRYYRWDGNVIRWDDLKSILNVKEFNSNIGIPL